MSRTPVQVLPVPYLILPPIEAYSQDTGTLNDSGSWPTANTAIYVPFSLPVTRLLKSITTMATTAVGNIDMGLYDGLLTTRLGSLGTTGRAAGFNTWTPSTPILLEAGVRYYYAVVASSTSGAFMRWDTSLFACRHGGVAQEATALPLPATPTPVQATNAFIPGIALDFAQ